MLFLSRGDIEWKGRCVPWLSVSLGMIMLPDGLYKDSGKTLEGPAVTKARHKTKREVRERVIWA